MSRAITRSSRTAMRSTATGAGREHAVVVGRAVTNRDRQLPKAMLASGGRQ